MPLTRRGSFNLTWTNSKPAVREDEIIRRCQKGEREPFAQLVDQHKNWIFTQIFRWVGEKTLAEEMAQDVFMKAYQEIRNFRGEAKFSTWLFQIARNRCHDFWRGRERHHLQNKSWEEIKGKPALSPQAEAQASQRQEIHRIRRVLDSLPENYREALSLRYLSEMSYKEISRSLGEGLSSVKMRVARGLEMLRKKLKEGGHERR